ncbi:alkene reductase [Aeromicrobium chenweiae]|uniref:Alkene reductase n=1 Tax=Aeromicrobium chenweiae TaxID=2079793 RepID=A0A2S0WR60_9ACTN|nr:alkene reductase [Aeromicrobium chenweiae]AWB93829.1 alkene reductase [Aeromicrobium chenweiae]TGN30874.1 alkene reductase [Aeromicrobium chenweiae]
MSDTLFTPWKVGGIELANRVVMAPMTRNRADVDGVLPDSAIEYYRQRACAGLIVTEATQPSAAGQGYPGTPGLHTDAQQDAWSRVADAVHGAGGRVFLQIMHTGRIGHASLQADGGPQLAPSAVRANLEVATATGEMVPAPEPRAMTHKEIATTIADYASCAARAVAAGMDGVEIHAANGYLPHQFLSPGTNRRDDEYGGSPVNRARFLVELSRAVAAQIGAERVGIRISPGGQFNDMADRDNEDTYLALVDELAADGFAYLHTLRGRTSVLHEELRRRWPSTYVVNTGYMGSSEIDEIGPIVENGVADLVSVGRLFISNPDLVDRWRSGTPRAEWDEDTFYAGGDRGYIDYPTATTQD